MCINNRVKPWKMNDIFFLISAHALYFLNDGMVY